MFRRNWASLPKDASFPSDLKGLGYFVNEQDEIRSIDNPDCYFKFFLNRNTRINDRQRFEFNHAMEKLVFERLEGEGLQKMTLPLESASPTPHVSMLASPNLQTRSRVVVIFGEPTQDIGILAGRVANGPGGLNKGSLVLTVRHLMAQQASPTDKSPPGIVLANIGQRYWWPEGKRAITVSASSAIHLSSMVHVGRKYVPALNDIAGSETPLRHVESVFKYALASIAEHAKVDIIAIGESCEAVEKFLDNLGNWDTWGSRLNAMALLGNIYASEHLTNQGFKEFLAKRARSYMVSDEPANTPLAPPEGNKSLLIDPLGTPCYSSGESQHTELILIKDIDSILGYLEEVALTPDFKNSVITVVERPPKQEVTEEAWEQVPDEQRPGISTVNQEELQKQVKQLRRWNKFQQTGQAPGSDDENSDVEEEPRVIPPGTGWESL